MAFTTIKQMSSYQRQKRQCVLVARDTSLGSSPTRFMSTTARCLSQRDQEMRPIAAVRLETPWGTTGTLLARSRRLRSCRLSMNHEGRHVGQRDLCSSISPISPRMKTQSRKPSETAEPQQRQNPKTCRMKQLHHIPKSYFLIVLKAKNNPSFLLLLLFTEGQTDIHIFGRKHIHP